MYLSKKQISALEMAIEAMENNPLRNDETDEAIDTIVNMLRSATKTQTKRK